MNLIEQSYIFTDRELMLLLASSGVDSIYGFGLPEERDVTREEMILSLHSLISKKFLIPEDASGISYSPGEQIQILFSTIKNAECTIEAVSRDDDSQMIFYKTGDRLTLIEKETKYNDAKEDRFRLRPVTAGVFKGLLSDMPSSFGAEDLLEEKESQKFLKVSPEIYETGQNLLNSRVPISDPVHNFMDDAYPCHEQFRGYIEVKNEKKNRCSRFVIMEQGLYKYIIFYDNDNAEVNIYTKEKQSELIDWLRDLKH